MNTTRINRLSGASLHQAATRTPVVALVLAGCAAFAPAALSQTPFSAIFEDVNLVIPDGFGPGASDTRTVASGLGPILSLTVSLEIAGGYTGDLYALLIHDGVSTVLLNRPGRRAGDTLGYADSGLSVTFDDLAAHDVHTYRLALSGDHTTPVLGGLTGTWQPDARIADPAAVFDTSLRSSFLSSLHGRTPDGEWTLFIADLSPVGEPTLRSWSLDIMAVPEPTEIALGAGLGLLGWAFWRRNTRRITSPNTSRP